MSKAKKIIYGLCLAWSSVCWAEEIPYFNPYTQTFLSIEAKKVYESPQFIFYEEVKREKSLTREAISEMVREIDENILPNTSFLFSFLERGPQFPLRFIFSDRLKNNEGNEALYRAFYTPFYKEQYGYEAILVNNLGLEREEFLSDVAHELFHLYYRLKDPNPAVWMDEGLAQFFAYQMTGVVPQLRAAKYFEAPLVALEEFPEGISRYYGHSFLFFFYLKEHFLSVKDLPKLAIVSHPKNLFGEETWKKILREFSLAKLLNTVYYHEEGHYSLKPLFGKVRPLAQLPQNFVPKPDLNVYLHGSLENLKQILDLNEKLTEGASPPWQTELLFVLMPPYRKIVITSDQALLSENVPYTIVFNIY
ncbi:MAG: hypothetical protein HYY62_01440 [Deltaproteobacteria bacterium]|nr:hypothetical protein [Deltaproteobacteria bacterium]